MPLSSKSSRKLFLTASTFVLILGAFPAAIAQTVPCKLSLSSLKAAPELKGFQLGMTMEQAKTHVPQIVFGPTDALGSSKTTINPGFDPRADKSRFQDVRTISLDFLDGRLVSLWIGYDTNFKWTTVGDFATGISESLSLPNAWTDWKLRGKQMSCADFEMTISMIAQSPSFRIVDTTASETLAARRTAAASEAEAEDEEEAAEPEEEIIADRKTKTYFQNGCRPQNPIADANRITFKTSAEAEKAGYKLSKGCS